jgi:transcription antitermination factor NusG
VKFKKGDRVRVLRGVTPYAGKAGTVEDIEETRRGHRYLVYLDLMGSHSTPHSKAYWEDELKSA